jgi:hypothetical protein
MVLSPEVVSPSAQILFGGAPMDDSIQSGILNGFKALCRHFRSCRRAWRVLRMAQPFG